MLRGRIEQLLTVTVVREPAPTQVQPGTALPFAFTRATSHLPSQVSSRPLCTLLTFCWPLPEASLGPRPCCHTGRRCPAGHAGAQEAATVDAAACGQAFKQA